MEWACSAAGLSPRPAMLCGMTIRPHPRVLWSSVSLSGALATACGSGQLPAPAAGSGDAAFITLARDVLDDHYKRNPSHATDLGIHQYDSQLEDLSQGAIRAESEALKDFRSKLAAVDPSTLTLTNALDREQLIHSMDA